MASRKRRRGAGGHPAKVAARRRRERGGTGEGSPQQALRRLVSTVCAEALRCKTALEAELLASELLGSWWPERTEMGDEDPDLEAGGALVEEMRRRGDPGALAALIATAEVSDGELGLLARRHAETLRARGVTPPRWADAILEAKILRTAVMREDVFDDGATVFIEAAHGDGDRHAIGVYIDNNLGVMAKEILIADSIESVEEVMRDHEEDHGVLRLEEIDPAEAGARILAALELTDLTIDPPVGEDYARLRAVALLRAYEVPVGQVNVEAAEVPAAARDSLLEQFLASPEAAGIEPDSDAADVVSLAIDFCSDYVDGRSLRWSPVVVELFMTAWLPHKVLAAEELFEAVPHGLEAWVRFAGRERGLPRWAIDRTVGAIDEWVEEMRGRAADPVAADPAKRFIAAAQAAGVDLTDEKALEGFVAGWNARSDAA